MTQSRDEITRENGLPPAALAAILIAIAAACAVLGNIIGRI